MTGRLLWLALATIGCVDPSNESTTNQHAETHNRLATNRLATNRIATNRLATNRLATNGLSSTKLVALAETADILSTSDGRDVYSYVVSCALPSDVTISAFIADAADTAPPDSNYTCSAGNCTFTGGVGLTPRWAEHKLDHAGKGWISACLFSRVNLFDTAEAISLRGANDGLTITADEASIYTLQEGAFYGNYFNDLSQPIDWWACRGQDQAAGETGGLVLRDCTEEDPANPGKTYCGFNYAGDCADYSPQFPTPYACRSFDTALTAYADCYGGSGNGKFGGLPKYPQVITSYVSP